MIIVVRSKGSAHPTEYLCKLLSAQVVGLLEKVKSTPIITDLSKVETVYHSEASVF